MSETEGSLAGGLDDLASCFSLKHACDQLFSPERVGSVKSRGDTCVPCVVWEKWRGRAQIRASPRRYLGHK